VPILKSVLGDLQPIPVSLHRVMRYLNIAGFYTFEVASIYKRQKILQL